MTFCIPISPALEPYSYAILLISFLFNGFSRGFDLLIEYIFNLYFDSGGKDRIAVSIWLGFTLLGDVFGLISTSTLINDYGWGWKGSLSAWILLFMAISALFYALVDEEVDYKG